MIVYALIRETLKNEYDPPNIEIIKTYSNFDDAQNYIKDLEEIEANRRTKVEKCDNCTADFDNEINPECYSSDNIDPACKNAVYEYPRCKYYIKDLHVIESKPVVLNHRGMK